MISKLYLWAGGALTAIIAALTIMLQRKTIKAQDVEIKEKNKVIEVKSAVSKTDKDAENEANKNIAESAYKARNGHRGYFTNDGLRDD
jgi:beta-lactamase regulating signal transducer with metallopeptidase domain